MDSIFRAAFDSRHLNELCETLPSLPCSFRTVTWSVTCVCCVLYIRCAFRLVAHGAVFHKNRRDSVTVQCKNRLECDDRTLAEISII